MFQEETDTLREIFEGNITEEILKFSIEETVTASSNAAFENFCNESEIALPGVKLYVGATVDMEVVETALRKNKKIANIKFKHMNNYKVNRIGKSLETNFTLETLDLEGTPVSYLGATVIAIALEKNATLKNLYLTRTQFCDLGATKIAKALESNNTLESLELEGTRTSDEGATAIAKALWTNKSLKKLYLEAAVPKSLTKG